MFRSFALVLFVALGLPAPAAAQDAAETIELDELPGSALEPPTEPEPEPVPAPPPPSVERVAVLLVPTGDVDPGTTDALTELLISEVAARGVSSIVGKEELQALLGRDDAGILACVESGVCLGQISVELGVREVVAGTLGRRDDTWVFALARIDARTGETSGRVFREVDGDLSALVRSLSSSVPELYVAPVRPGRLVLEILDDRTGLHVAGAAVFLDEVPIGTTDGTTFRRELVEPGPHTLEIRARRHAPLVREIDVEEGATLVLDATLTPVERGLELSPLTWAPASLGVVALATAIGLGVTSQATPEPTATMRETFTFVEAREREAIAANVLFAVAGAALVLSTVSLVLDLTRGDEEPSVSLVVGSGLALHGTWP